MSTTCLVQPGFLMPYFLPNFSRSYSTYQGARMFLSLGLYAAMLPGFSDKQFARLQHRARQTWLPALTLPTNSTCTPQT